MYLGSNSCEPELSNIMRKARRTMGTCGLAKPNAFFMYSQSENSRSSTTP